jgi:DNA-binding CsgD family transcriptional regulator
MSVGRYAFPGGKIDAESARQVNSLLTNDGDQGPFHLLRAGFEALDLLNIGLTVTNVSGQLLLANRTAEQILAARDGLELSPRGVLQVMRGGKPALSWLTQPGRPAAPNGESAVSERVLAIPRSLGKRPLTLLVRSTRSASAKITASGPAALIFILDPDLPVEAAEAELRQLYGLTSTEARMANLLMKGKTLDDCCEQLAIRRSTARTHLQHLFEKTGVQRQSELVFLLLKSVGLVSTRHAEDSAVVPTGTPTLPAQRPV